MKKVLFIDRDGTLLWEPPKTHQINTLEELYFLPGTLSALKKFSSAGYLLVMVTNQDGLGSHQNPLENYKKINQKIFDILASEGIFFCDELCCSHLPEEKCFCRKPNTALFDAFFRKHPDINLSRSLLIGDRKTDIEFAKNIGVSGFLLRSAAFLENVVQYEKGEGITWEEIAEQVLKSPRTANVTRKTNETEISVLLNIDGSGKYDISTGIRFFDHMLEQLARHGGMDVTLSAKGDLDIDEHHTVEDVAIVLGEAFRKALGDARGIERYAWERILPMDEAKAEISVDLSGRPFLVFSADFSREFVGDFPTEMVSHFFRSFADAAKITLHIILSGENTHHMVEAGFKGFARCLKDAVNCSSTAIPSTKGVL
ncbi:bifunctional histidinol-phosphatase/imidazoleglycerol-phosphate dehydratase HisB [Candidatus Peregrinibacteria bacterium]|nr:MAG: bifunctional histidinol-phosphatase/imidazoleglycerol-phosphate dehydratase HisB [Candidatus Peregrinibacteria bacterium]